MSTFATQLSIMISFPTEWPYFFNATILDWKPLLQDDNAKQIIVESLRFLVKENRITLTAFVVMNTHIHIVWQPLAEFTKQNIQLQFMKYTAQQLKFYLQITDIEFLKEFYINKKDREYQFWRRNSLSTELFTEAAFY